MTRLAIEAGARESVGTVEASDEEIWDGTVRFDPAVRVSQDLPDDVAEQFADQYDAYVLADESDVDVDDLEADETDPETAAEQPTLDEAEAIVDGTVDEVAERLESGDYDDHLAEIESAERDGSDRKGVYEAIVDRREVRADDEDVRRGTEQENNDAATE